MTALTKRNCLIYFRSPSTVALSLIGTLMVLLLYVVFLGDNMAEGFTMLPDAKTLVNTWMLAGMCAVAPLTSSLSVVGALVNDRESGAARDFAAAPVRRYKIVGGYLASGVIASFFIGCVVLAVALVWVGLGAGTAPSLALVLACLGVMLLSSISSSCITFFIVSLVQKQGSFSAVSTLVGTLGGFLAGIYLPVGTLPAAVRGVVMAFPPSHAAVLLRTMLLEGMAADSFASLPAAALQEVYEILGVRFYLGGTLLPLWVSAAVLAGSAALFFLLSCVSISRKKR